MPGDLRDPRGEGVSPLEKSGGLARVDCDHFGVRARHLDQPRQLLPGPALGVGVQGWGLRV